ncbi:hypothetical protein [Pedobacter sp. ASV28]|jgi:hypothetical protein|uniref:hypothetical protein n=1 Tax=Pedobacter sp. ASV28 TaxID=2795123 RepID=UPI0018EC3FEF|nr:hypothetical protein [Pedobacter sp. ASV28]
MMLKKALHNQSVFDFALLHTGSIMGVLAFCQSNAISLTDDLIAGQEYLVPEGILSDTDIKIYYANNGYKPATAIQGNTTIITDYGIGDMIIGNSFLVR